MMYCTKCGSNMKGSGKLCPVCGYEVNKMRTDLSIPRQVRQSREEQRAWAPPIPDQRGERVQQERRMAAKEPMRWGKPEDERNTVSPEFVSPFETLGKERPKVTLAEGEERDKEEVDEDPRFVTGCSVCGGRPVNRCFFTQAPLCQRHTLRMQIFVRNQPFGEIVPASPSMASSKVGKNPTPAEAQEAGMFFSIKPYHEWKRVI
ncbi:MAG: hypothetical protein MUC62_08110 [Candidatus Thermoplasmatota archaeon]|nr:hypothetical protein [Candidatus Thermoplasmatota archaeon]